MKKTLIVLMTIMTLNACRQCVDGQFCAIAEHITYSAKNDSKETIKQIVRHNAVVDLCK